MQTKIPVLFAAGLIANVPKGDEGVPHDVIEQICELVINAMKSLARSDPRLEATSVVSFHYLGEPYENARRCRVCNRWTTDRDRPREIDCIADGVDRGLGLMCQQCLEAEKEGV
jgi:hypothetical protein